MTVSLIVALQTFLYTTHVPKKNLGGRWAAVCRSAKIVMPSCCAKLCGATAPDWVDVLGCVF